MPENPNTEPWRIHGAEQVWAQADEHLGKIIANLQLMEPNIYEQAAGNDDASVLYDYLKGFITRSAKTDPGALDTSLLMCAAAITRLVRASRTDTDILAQLDWKEQPET